MPASYAATTQRSIMRVRGSGWARAVTITSWSAFATMMRSLRASVPSSPDVSPTMSTRSPHTTRLRVSSRAFIARMVRSVGWSSSSRSV